MAEQKIKKLSHKDVSKMSTQEFLENAKLPLKRLLSYVKPYRARFALGVMFGVMFGVFNGVMLGGFRVVFQILLPGDEPAESVNMPFFGEVALPSPDLDGSHAIWVILAVASVIPLMLAIRGVFAYLNQYMMLWVGQKVLHDLRRQCFHRLMNHSLQFYSKEKGGELMQTVFNRTRMAASVGSDLASSMVKHPISMLSIVAVLFWIDWLFAVCALVVFPLCLLPVLFVSKKVRKAGGREEEEAGMLMVVLQESFAGIRVVKSHAREDFELGRFTSANLLLLKMIMRWRKAMIIVAPMVETVASIGIAAGLVYAWATDMSAGEFLIRYIALIALYPHAKALSQLQIQLQKCLVASTKVFEILDREYEVKDKPDAIVLEDVRGDITFDNVTFAYGKDKPAVNKINLHMEPGKKYALVGESGAGKSTLFSLIMRFYDPLKGTVKLDGHDLRDVTQQSLRQHIGMVNQDTFLFHDTIAANIRYGKLDATDEEIEEAARKAHAHDFIMATTNGYDTVIGDKGSNLSGGQQQRLTIARAFVRNAPILLLDEATSALDSQSELYIQEAIEKLSEGKTVIAIAHRLSTILNSDFIVMMDKGRILKVGPHSELMESSQEYRKIYNLQYNQGNGSGGKVVAGAEGTDGRR